MKKIFALVAFAMTVLCSTSAFAMDAGKKRTADEMEQEDSNQNSPFATPGAGSPDIQTAPGAPGKERTTEPAGGDWNAEVARTLSFGDQSSSESFEYDGLELVEIVQATPAAPDNDAEFNAAFAEMNEAPK